MRTNYEVLEQLLAELIAACRDNNIRLFALTEDAEALIQHTLRRRNAYDADYVIFADDYDKLIKALEANDGRVAESLYNNPDMPGTLIRYSDKTTMLYNPAEHGEYLCNGIHINIWPLVRRPSGSMSDKILNYMERLCEQKESAKILRYSTAFGIKQKAIGALWSICGRKRMSAGLLRRIISRSSVSKGAYTFHYPNAAILRITGGEIKDLPVINCGDFGVRVLNERTEIGREYYRGAKAPRNYSIMSTGTTWDEFLKQADPSLIPDKDRVMKLARAREKIYLSRLRGIREYWDLLQMAYDRVRYYDELGSRKNEIISLYENGDYRSIRTVLNNYIASLTFFAKRKMALCFDVDIFEIALAAIAENGEYKLAEELAEFVRPEHMESVEEFTEREKNGGELDMKECRERREALIGRLKAFIDDHMEQGEKEAEENNSAAAESVVRNRTVTVTEEPDRVIVDLFTRNINCEPEFRERRGRQVIEADSVSMADIRRDLEYVDIEYVINKEIAESQLLRDAVEYLVCLSKTAGSAEYILFEAAEHFHNKIKLYHLLNQDAGGGR